MRFSVQAHVTYRTRYHIVWIPKYRRKVLVKGVDKYFEKTIKTYLIDRYPDVLVLECNVQADHVHLMLEIAPKYSVSKIVGDIKSNTARLLKKKFTYLASKKNLWSVGYFVSTVGINEKVVRDYILKQEEQDKGRAELALG